METSEVSSVNIAFQETWDSTPIQLQRTYYALPEVENNEDFVFVNVSVDVRPFCGNISPKNLRDGES